jgi:hypothetical protein
MAPSSGRSTMEDSRFQSEARSIGHKSFSLLTLGTPTSILGSDADSVINSSDASSPVVVDLLVFI